MPHHNDLILDSIPGISLVTALSLLGELDDTRRFRNANDFVGVDLRHYEFGKLVMSDHIGKRGAAVVLKLLYHA
ncbi:IS110 family transposase [Lactobacillus xylocopicola]|uniref:Transposase IS116/IS110/IS902 C-terminal domain-containing protein n=1 Tax=Lactobacillus xylocopicola TaxID=2976676 RepID=A0ABM8BHV6_9LACO|nr:IS110 family transposase [Lactobacillus xylocopicola]BDR60871.1 hypothetical protein KIM322_11320 [Lactobacillus xylocopicola]